jgi:ankyrin repeat protein
LPVVKALVSGGANILAANNYGDIPIDRAMRTGNTRIPIDRALSSRKSAVAKYLLQQMYASTRRFPLHQLLDDLTWMSNHNSSVFDGPPLRQALRLYILDTDDVVDIIEYLVGQNPALLSLCDQDGSLPLHVACRRGVSFTIVQSLVNMYKASVKSLTSEGDLPVFLACEMPATSLDSIFLLMKLYPDVIYRSSLENRCGGDYSF